MVIFGTRKNEHAIFTSKETASFSPESLLITPDVLENGIVFAFPDVCEDRIATITLPAETAWELFNAGRLKFKK